MRTVAALLCVASLGACTGSEPPTPPQPSVSASVGEEPRERVRFGVLGAPITLDPYAAQATDLTWSLARPLYPSLYRKLPDGSAQPYLGEVMRSGPRSAVVELKPVRWPNGRRVTAGDVISSWDRAGPISGFSRIRSMIADGDSITMRGPVDDWEEALATRALVLPAGRSKPKGGWTLRVQRHVPGLKVVYRPGPHPGLQLERVEVLFVSSVGTMLAMLEAGDLDAAAIPSTVNLSARIEERGLQHEAALGDEIILLRGAGSGYLDLRSLHEGLIRTDGALAEGPHVSSSVPDVLAAPAGDELLTLLQEAIQLQMDAGGTEIEIVQPALEDLYGPGFDTPRLERRFRPVPGSHDALFTVRTYLVWRPGGIEGLDVNPTAEGPLWNVERWSAP